MFKILEGKSQYFKAFYACNLVGYGLIIMTYLLRTSVAGEASITDFSLGIMPNLAGSFATPFLLLMLLSIQFRRPQLLQHWAVFLAANSFTFFTALFIEYLHVWFELGNFDRFDVVASGVGFGLAVMVFVLLHRTYSGEGQLEHLQDNPDLIKRALRT